MSVECIKNDPEEMKIAREASWLCNLFQKNNMTVEEKQKIIRKVTREHKRKESLNGQSN